LVVRVRRACRPANRDSLISSADRGSQITNPRIAYYSWLSLSDLFSRRRKDDADAVDAGADSPVYATKALTKFLAGLNGRSQPLILDLGPVVGANVNFFGEELGCKILVGNLTEDIDQHHKEGKADQLAAFFESALTRERTRSTASWRGMSSTISTGRRVRPSPGS